MNSLISTYKEAYSGHSKQIWVLAFLTFVNRMGMLVIPFLSVYLTTILNFSKYQAGLLLSAFGFGSLLGSYVGGKLSDRIGSQNVIVLSLLISGFFLIGLQFFTSFYSLFIFIFLTATFGEAYRPALYAAVGEYTKKEETGRAMALIRLSINAGFAAGPAIGGFVAVLYGYKYIFWIDGITCILAGIVYLIAIAFYLKKDNQKRRDEKLAIVDSNLSVKSPLKNKQFLRLLVVTLLVGIGFIQWFHSIPVFIKEEWGFDERYIGLMMMMNGVLITLLELPLIHYLEKKGFKNKAIFMGIALIALSFPVFLLPKAVAFIFVAMLFFTFGEILYMPFNSSTAVNLSNSNNRGTYMAYYSMTWSLTHIIGPLLGLSLAAKYGYHLLWVVLILFIVAALWVNKGLRE